MSDLYDRIDDSLAAWIQAQPVFFVGTAPLSPDGRVNVSPKGMDGTFAVLGPHTVGYLDYHGSGVETIAHLREPGNGRICLMFCAFTGRPRILRLHGHGRYLRPDHPDFAATRARFRKERTTGQRAVILVDVDRIADSCGYAVPLMEFVEDRVVLDLHQEKKGAAAYVTYGQERNARSIDGLAGLLHE